MNEDKLVEKINQLETKKRHHLLAGLSYHDRMDEQFVKKIKPFVYEAIDYFKSKDDFKIPERTFNNVEIVINLCDVLKEYPIAFNFLKEKGNLLGAFHYAKAYDFNKAIKLAEEIVEDDTFESRTILNEAGLLSYKHKDVEKAKDFFLRAKSFKYLAKIYKQEGNIQEAIKYFIKNRNFNVAADLFLTLDEPLFAVRLYLLKDKNDNYLSDNTVESEKALDVAIKNSLFEESFPYFVKSHDYHSTVKLAIASKDNDLIFQSYVLSYKDSWRNSVHELITFAIDSNYLSETAILFEENCDFFHLGYLYEKNNDFNSAAEAFKTAGYYNLAAENYKVAKNTDLANVCIEVYEQQELFLEGQSHS